jgi:hypothetical protein
MPWRRSASGARIHGQVRLSSWLGFLALLLICACPRAFAKCPVASVTLKGRVLSSAADTVVIKVELLTPKGNFVEQVDAAGSEFAITVKFPTASSYSPFWGHRCNNRPKKVVVIVKTGDKVLVRKELNFQADFEPSGQNEYRLRTELVLDMSAQVLPGWVPHTSSAGGWPTLRAKTARRMGHPQLRSPRNPAAWKGGPPAIR